MGSKQTPRSYVLNGPKPKTIEQLLECDDALGRAAIRRDLYVAKRKEEIYQEFPDKAQCKQALAQLREEVRAGWEETVALRRAWLVSSHK